MNDNYAKREALKKKWLYFRPLGPHDSEKGNIEEMHERDVEKMMEIADEMAELL
jgi:hypothetical protein